MSYEPWIVPKAHCTLLIAIYIYFNYSFSIVKFQFISHPAGISDRGRGSLLVVIEVVVGLVGQHILVVVAYLRPPLSVPPTPRGAYPSDTTSPPSGNRAGA